MKNEKQLRENGGSQHQPLRASQTLSGSGFTANKPIRRPDIDNIKVITLPILQDACATKLNQDVHKSRECSGSPSLNILGAHLPFYQETSGHWLA